MFEVVLRGLEVLREQGFVPSATEFDESFCLVGKESIVDSVAFVVLITSIEEFLVSNSGKDVTIDLSQIPELSGNTPSMTAGELASHIKLIASRN